MIRLRVDIPEKEGKQHFPLTIKYNCSVEELKVQIYKERGHPVKEQRLYFREQRLRNYQSMTDYEIKDRDKL